MDYCCALYNKTGRSLLAIHHTLCGKNRQVFSYSTFPGHDEYLPLIRLWSGWNEAFSWEAGSPDKYLEEMWRGHVSEGADEAHR